MSTSANIKTFRRDLKERASFQEEVFNAIAQKIKERLHEKKREKEIILDRFISATKGKSIILEHKKM